MDIILPYVAWISLLAMVMDVGLQLIAAAPSLGASGEGQR
jgi:hypothetical protein